jgi:protein-disulfide isomerase
MKAASGLALLLAAQLLTEPSLLAQTQGQQAVEAQLKRLETRLDGLAEKIGELSALLRASLPPQPISEIAPIDVAIARAAIRGSANAKVVLLEFTDFECPFCGRHAQLVYPTLQREFVDSGKVRYVVRNLPLEALHRNALKSAEAAECSREQGKYWEMHDRLFTNQKSLDTASLIDHAGNIGLDKTQFVSCLENGTMTAKVREDLDEAKRLGLTGTPAFLLGTVTQEGTVRVTQKISGSQPLQVFKTALDRALSRAESEGTSQGGEGVPK